MAFMAAAVGLLVVNFPFGKIFLGDAGAYSSGHILAWVAIILIYKHPQISAWSILLCFFWPVIETLYSIYRRKSRGIKALTADNYHFHHLVYKNIAIKMGRGTLDITINSMSTLVITPFLILSGFFSYLFIFNSLVSLSIIVILSTSYLILYKVLYKICKKSLMERREQN